MNQKKNGEFISQQRKLKKLTQEQLAEKMGVSINAVSKWERGLSFPDVSLYKRLCNELGISIEELINGEKDNSEEAKERAIIKTIKSKEKTKKKLIFVVCVLLMIIIGIIINFVFFYKSAEDKLQEYYDRNFQMSFVARDVDALLKYRNNGKYPDYYGGTYISNNANYLIVQVVKNKIPKEGTMEHQYYNELITLNNSIKIEYVKNSYNNLESTYNKLNEYFIEHTLPNYNGHGIDIMNNCVMVFLDKIEDKTIEKFKNNIFNSDLIQFKSSRENVDYSKICSNYPENIGDEPLELANKTALISIELETTEYIPVLLTLYDDGYYELFTAYESCKPGKNCNSILKYTKSIKGKYNYDVKKIIDSSTNREKFKLTNKNKPKYRILLGEKYIKEYDTLEFVIEQNKKNRYLEELLKEIKVDLSKCAKPEYMD